MWIKRFWNGLISDEMSWYRAGRAAAALLGLIFNAAVFAFVFVAVWRLID